MLTYRCEARTITNGNTGRRPMTFGNILWHNGLINNKVQLGSKGSDENSVVSQCFYKCNIYWSCNAWKWGRHGLGQY